MGFLDDLRDAFSKQATKPKANKTQGEKVLGNTIKLIGSLNGKTKVVEKTSYDPKIEHVSWINKATQKPTESAKYGRPMCLKIATNNSHGSMCSAVAVLSCKDWIDEERAFEFPSTMWSDAKVSVFRTLEITPKVEWLKDKDVAESEIKAKIHLVFLNPFDATRFFLDYAEENVKAVKLAGLIKERKKVVSMSDMDAKPIKLSKIVIVIDPGHGYDTGFTGTECRGFKYYERGTSGEPDKTRTKTASAENLPDYVLENIKKWIVRWVNITISKEKQEWFYVIDVCLLLKEKLARETKLKVIMTREVETLPKKRVQLKGKDIYSNRRKVVNENNADYFISIHCDGQGTGEIDSKQDLKFQLSGAFVVVPRGVDTNSNGKDLRLSEELGKHIIENYSIVNPDKKNPVQEAADEKAVLRKENSAQRRVIVELGRMTNPLDIIKLYDSEAKMKIAEQLKNGIIYNIVNSYEKE